jgi:hypothetical protein
VQERRVVGPYLGVSRSERPEATTREGGALTPTSSLSSVLSPDDPVTSDTYPHAATPAPKEQMRPTFELRCADVHPVGCEEALRARSAHDLVALACEHGGLVHGFTPVWYSSERLASIAAAVTARPG